MKAKILILTAIIVTIFACNKDTYTTKPQLTFKSVNGKVFTGAAAIIFSLEFTDAEGDISDSIWVQKVTKTKRTTQKHKTHTRTILSLSFSPSIPGGGILK